MKFRGTLFLAVVFAALCGTYWFLSQREEAATQRLEEARRVIEQPADTLTRVSLLRRGAPAITAERAAAGWAITEPAADIRPDEGRLDKLAEAVSGLMRERSLDVASDLATYGLAEPELTVKADFGPGGAVEVAFGIMEPVQVNRYARINGGDIVLISNKSFQALNRSLDDLRDRRVFHFAPEAYRRIEFARLWNGQGDAPPGETPALGAELARVAVTRDSDAEPWRVVEPLEAPADQELITALVEQVASLNGHGYVDRPESLADYGLEPAWARLTVSGADGAAPETLLLGSADMTDKETAGLFVRLGDRPAVFSVDPYFVNTLPLKRTHFRDARLVTRSVKKLNLLQYASPDGEFVLMKDPGQGWQLEVPEAAPADQVAVSTLVSELLEMNALDFPAGAPEAFGLDAPRITITLGFENAAEVAVLRFAEGPPESDACFATQDTGAIVMLPAESLALLSRTSADLKSFELLRFDKSAAAKVTFTLDDETYVLENQAGQWRATMPVNAVLQNQEDAKAILGELSPLKAEAGLARDQDLAYYGLERPAFTAIVDTLDPGNTARLRRYGPVYVGGPVDGTSQRRYAAVDGREGIYVIGPGLLERVREAVRGFRPATP